MSLKLFYRLLVWKLGPSSAFGSTNIKNTLVFG